MNKEPTLEGSQTDWEALDNMRDEDIDLSDIPEITAAQMARATLRVGGRPIARGKVRINIYLDREVVDHFKTEAGGRGYQTLINETLRESMRAQELETVLRRVIREEMTDAAAYGSKPQN